MIELRRLLIEWRISGAPVNGFLKRLSEFRVKDAIRGQAPTSSPDAPVAELAAEMVRRHVRRNIGVADERPAGIVSSTRREILKKSHKNAANRHARIALKIFKYIVASMQGDD